ncbi:hypothetical protein SAMN03080615_01684 [Amphritea atlantica]|uniref:Uncharacterized protein n=1 Tax=Amphritea atlantica TaxID=355243 RepID=A0A1H9GHJ7_9GAMM|nr:alpha-galactosidase [Amphritea atlantica]SEQ49565.1 hypothetical protein SAMN03080615_01684 [Amphritea atlantica]
MNYVTYQVFFTNENGEIEYLPDNFYSEEKAMRAVDRLIKKGYVDAQYESIDVEVDDFN